MMKWKATLADEEKIQRTLVRLAHQILERNRVEQLCLVGIRTRGIPLAHRLADNIARIAGVKVDVGALDITLYRDDLTEIAEQPTVGATDISFSLVNRHLVLVDDVIYTGRTTRAAMDAIVAIGRPASIQLAVLVDRGHRELPIRADYVGINIPTAKNEMVSVLLAETDGETEIRLYELTP